MTNEDKALLDLCNPQTLPLHVATKITEGITISIRNKRNRDGVFTAAEERLPAAQVLDANILRFIEDGRGGYVVEFVLNVKYPDLQPATWTGICAIGETELVRYNCDNLVITSVS